MRRAALALGILAVVGAVAWLLPSRRGVGGADPEDRTESETSAAGGPASLGDRSPELAAGRTPRLGPASGSVDGGDDPGPASTRGARPAVRVVMATPGESVEGVTIRRVADPFHPVADGPAGPIRIDARHGIADVDLVDDDGIAYLELRATGRVTEIVAARGDRTTLVSFRASRVVEGVALEEGSERPVPGVTLVPSPWSRGDVWSVPAASEASGRFRLEVPTEGVAQLIADPGSGAARFVDLPAATARSGTFVVHVARRVSLGGRVLVGGVPVEGAILRSSDPYGPLAETRTDAGGAYFVPRLPEGALAVEVNVGAARGGRVRRMLTIRGDERGHAEEEFSIEAPWTISGRVTSGGHGVAGALVRTGQNTPGAERGAAETVTAADGTFVVRGLFSTRPAVFLGVTTPERVYAETSVTVDPVAREARNVAIEIPARARLSGRVLDRDGRPIAGARVGVVPDRFDREPWTTADADGRYVLLVARGPVSIYARATGFAPGEASWPSVHDGDVGDVVLARGGRVAGRVVDEAGRPVVSAYVSCTSDDRTVKSTFVQTDADGAFTIGPIAGTSLHLAVTRYELGYAQKDVDGVAPDSIVPDIVLVK